MGRDSAYNNVRFDGPLRSAPLRTQRYKRSEKSRHHVACLLPCRALQSGERLARFILEAKAA